MRLNPFLMPIILIVALFGTVFTAQALDKWSVSGKTAIDVTNLTPADLKGWMTLQQVIDGLNMSKEDVYAAGNIPADLPTSTALKDLESLIPGFSTTTLRDAVTQKLGGAAPAAAPPKASAEKTPAAATFVATPAASVSATHVPSSGTVAGATPTALPPGQMLPASQIKGSMSLKNVSQQCGVPLAQVLAGLNLPPDTNPDTLLKDLVAQGKIKEVTDVQQIVAALQTK